DKKEYSKMFIESLSSDKTKIEEYYGLPVEDGWEVTDFYADDALFCGVVWLCVFMKSCSAS
ncbi:MAG: hypothetical protein NC299_17360, partial [Lachnospiraceae bacterium]|nr:hypothetical protein [Lachnospiraceae bacterium]